MDDNNVGYFGRSNKILDDFLSKLAESQPNTEPPIINKDQVLKDFESFEEAVRQSPKMRQVFAALKQKFEEDPNYKAQVDPSFVAGVMLLNLPSEQE